MTVRLVALCVFTAYTLVLLAVGARFMRTAMDDDPATSRRRGGNLIMLIGGWEFLVGVVVIVDGAPASVVIGPMFMGVFLVLGAVVARKFAGLFPEPPPRGVSLVKAPKPQWVPSWTIREDEIG